MKAQTSLMKKAVIAKYPKAYAARDVDDYWWIWSPDLRVVLNDARDPTKSAAKAWESAAAKLTHNASLERRGTVQLEQGTELSPRPSRSDC